MPGYSKQIPLLGIRRCLQLVSGPHLNALGNDAFGGLVVVRMNHGSHLWSNLVVWNSVSSWHFRRSFSSSSMQFYPAKTYAIVRRHRNSGKPHRSARYDATIPIFAEEKFT